MVSHSLQSVPIAIYRGIVHTLAVSAHSLRFRGNACDCVWCMCDSSNEVTMIVLHLPHESNPSVKKSVSILRKWSACSEKEFTQSICGEHFAIMTFHPRITRMLCDMGSSGSWPVLLPQGCRVGLEFERKCCNQGCFVKPLTLKFLLCSCEES